MRVKRTQPGADTSLGDEVVASLAEGLAILRGRATPSVLWEPVPDGAGYRMEARRPRRGQRYVSGRLVDWRKAKRLTRRA